MKMLARVLVLLALCCGSGQAQQTTVIGPSNITISGKSVSLGGSYTPVRATANAASPTGTASATLVMMGVAGSFTPATSGNMFLSAHASFQQNTNGDGCLYSLRVGTGTAPVNGAAVTGTQVEPQQGAVIMSANTQVVSGGLAGYVTGLTVSTAYWMDIAAAAITGGTCSTSRIGIVALEQ